MGMELFLMHAAYQLVSDQRLVQVTTVACLQLELHIPQKLLKGLPFLLVGVKHVSFITFICFGTAFPLESIDNNSIIVLTLRFR